MRLRTPNTPEERRSPHGCRLRVEETRQDLVRLRRLSVVICILSALKFGPVKSVTYDVSDDEKGEISGEHDVTIAFKAQATEQRDRIIGCFNQMSTLKLTSILSNEDDFPELYAAIEHIKKKVRILLVLEGTLFDTYQ
jgi:hypothetical protein